MPFDLALWGLPALVAGFAGAALRIAVAGVVVVTRADTIADRTGLGEAEGPKRSSAWIYGTFGLAVATLAGAGYLVTQFGIDDTAVGGLLVATVTSLPELVTTITAVRRLYVPAVLVTL